MIRQYLATIRHLRGRQVSARLRHIVRYAAYRRFPGVAQRVCAPRSFVNASVRRWDAAHPNFAFLIPDISPEEITALLQRLAEGEFTYLNSTARFGDRVDWSAPTQPKLWRYHLHYCDEVRQLAAASGTAHADAAREALQRFTPHWIECNPAGVGDGWEPYPLSLRITNWCIALQCLGLADEPEAPVVRPLLQSLHAQAAFLSAHLEYHICGNHLIKNGKALVFAGLLFEGAMAERWLERGLRLLRDELHEQVLPDGGHFERSPMYHQIVLDDYLEVVALLLATGTLVPTEFGERLAAMIDFLEGILHPDGDIPLLNDSTWDEPRSPVEVIRAGRELLKIPCQPAESSRTSSFPDTGYYVMRGGNDHGDRQMIVDCGPVCPDYLPAHAHSDTLSYELSLGSQRVVVDSGVYEYGEGSWRSYFRSTRAHNTLVIDDTEQSETWGSFRVGRRARPTKAALLTGDRAILFEGGHDGYLKPLGCSHRRRVLFVDDSFWIILDAVAGASSHRLDEYICLHPDLSARDTGNGIVAERGGQVVLHIVPIGAPEVSLLCGETNPVTGWYSPRFGVKEANTAIRLRYTLPLPCEIGYGLFPFEVQEFALHGDGRGRHVAFRLNGTEFDIEIADDNIGVDKRVAA